MFFHSVQFESSWNGLKIKTIGGDEQTGFEENPKCKHHFKYRLLIWWHSVYLPLHVFAVDYVDTCFVIENMYLFKNNEEEST